MELLKIILYIIAFIGVLAGTYYCCRFLSSMQTGVHKSKHIKTVDRLLLSKDSSLQIVKIGKRYVLLGITGSTVNVLLELSEDDIAFGEAVKDTEEKKDAAVKIWEGFAGMIRALRARAKNAEQTENFSDILKKEQDQSSS